VKASSEKSILPAQHLKTQMRESSCASSFLIQLRTKSAHSVTPFEVRYSWAIVVTSCSSFKHRTTIRPEKIEPRRIPIHGFTPVSTCTALEELTPCSRGMSQGGLKVGAIKPNM